MASAAKSQGGPTPLPPPLLNPLRSSGGPESGPGLGSEAAPQFIPAAIPIRGEGNASGGGLALSMAENEGWPYLLVIRGVLHGSLIRLEPNGVGHLIGRGADSDLPHPESNISRRHAKIDFDPLGRAYLHDLGSTNGTYLNGSRLQTQESVELRDGDYVMFGASVVVKFVRLSPNEQRLRHEIFEQTVRDRQTQVPNQECFIALLSPMILDALSHGQGAAVALMEIEGIGSLKRRFGKAAADEAIGRVAELLRPAVRPEDLIGRFDEAVFAFASPSASVAWAKDWTDSLRNRVAGRWLKRHNAMFRVDARLGAAFIAPGHPQALDAILRTARQALAEAWTEPGRRAVCRSFPH